MRFVREKCEQARGICVRAERIGLGEQRFHIRLCKIPRDLGMTAFASDPRDKKYRTARRQLISKRNRKGLLRQFWINRACQRIVIILLLLNARRLLTELVKLLPGPFVSISADHRKHRWAKIGRQRFWIGEISFKTISTTRDDFRIVQFSDCSNQARAQVSSGRAFAWVSFPPKRVKRRTQE